MLNFLFLQSVIEGHVRNVLPLTTAQIMNSPVLMQMIRNVVNVIQDTFWNPMVRNAHRVPRDHTAMGLPGHPVGILLLIAITTVHTQRPPQTRS